nr:hypothetical protein [Tanacetum cinerariifolium]
MHNMFKETDKEMLEKVLLTRARKGRYVSATKGGVKILEEAFNNEEEAIIDRLQHDIFSRVCIATKCHQIVSEEVQVEVSSDKFMAHVQEIGTWIINFFDDAIESQSTADEGTWKNLDGDYFMINIYDPQDPSDKGILWRRIKDFIHHNNGALVLFGDFNEVCFNFKRLGSTFSHSQADNLNTFITNNGLNELPMESRLFTWMNKARTKLSKLDRFYSPTMLWRLSLMLKLLLLISYGRIITLSFFIVIKLILDQLRLDSSILGLILKGLKFKIKAWLRETKSNERNHMEKFVAELNNIDIRINSNSTSDEERKSHIKLLHMIDKLDRLDSLDLQQKSRIKWDIEGDENSKFFHSIVNQRRRTNSIHGIICEGIWTTDPTQVKDTFMNFFKEKFELYDFNIDFPSTTFPSIIKSKDRNLLEKEVTIDEIKSAIWNGGNDKAPRPDGFTFGFIKRYWEIFKHDIQEFMIKFFESKKMPAGSNSSFMTLIPKHNGDGSVWGSGVGLFWCQEVWGKSRKTGCHFLAGSKIQEQEAEKFSQLTAAYRGGFKPKCP